MEIATYRRPHRWQLLTQRIAASKLGARLFSRILHRLDGFAMRLTSGRRSLTSIVADLPVVVLTTTGARSGQPRSVPLLAILDGDDVILIASNWGGARHPAWYYNLCANPAVTLSVEEKRGPYLAREATDTERARYWPQAVAMYAGYAAYEQRAGERKIPIIVLTPSDA